MLTDIAIRKIGPSEKRREVADGKVSGLYLVVQPSGVKSWALRYRAHGLPRKLTLGSYPGLDLAEARRKAQEALGDVARGNDPAAEKTAAREARRAEEKASDRLEDVGAKFVERYLKRQAGETWAREAERLLKREIYPKLGKTRLGDIKRADVHDVLDGIVDRGAPIVANRTLAVVRRLFNWAIERGIIVDSPCDKIKAPAAEESRDRTLSDDEIRLVWGAFERVGGAFGAIAKLLLMSGARRDEIASGRWSEIDLEARTWTIAKERSKNGVAHEIPLSAKAIEILKALPRIGDAKDAFLFSTTGRTPVSGFSRAKSAIDRAILDLMREEAKRRGDDPATVEAPAAWTLHDLRRSCASSMAGIGVAPHIIEAVLGHKSGVIRGVAAVYNKYSYASEKRQAIDAWARKLETILGGEREGKIVTFARK
jgi:integrase